MSRILIVEDEEVIRTALRKLLNHNGYEVEEVGAVDAASRLELDRFDLIITDLRLPGAPGTEMIRLAPAVPVLIMTSYASLRSAVDAMKLGAVEYIAKPFDHDEMLAAVEDILVRYRHRTQGAVTEAATDSDSQADPSTDHVWPVQRHGEGLHADPQGRPDRDHGPDPGRVRYRQGTRRPGTAPVKSPGQPTPDLRQLRGHSRNTD